MTETYESFSRPFDTSRIAAGAPITVELTMNESDREALAKEWGEPAILELSGEAKAARRAGLIEVEGRIRAVLTRVCVATLEPLKEEVDESFTALFTEHAPEPKEGEAEADLDAPEPIIDGRLDLGDVLLEQLVLALAPHPRIEDAEPIPDPRGDEKITPFDVLKSLQSKA